ncbi:hypothetical protein CRUP_029753 [Coryphaenoides rupestris]|nr:hypothetical protein CRUP_029753 [Coryphaenoides rupestris]
MADGEHAAAAAAAAATTGDNNPPLEAEQGPLVSVTFQKNPAYNQKYLEAQPKALGITQIGLSVYQVTWLCAIFASSHGNHPMTHMRTPFIIASEVVVVAGTLAIVARSLHIPTLRACLVLQIFAIIASVFNLIVVLLLQLDWTMDICWNPPNEISNNSRVLCLQMETVITVRAPPAPE